MDKPFVILGEASESDDEDKEVLRVVKSNKKIPAVTDNKGVIVPGEASESDSEHEEENCCDANLTQTGDTTHDLDEEVTISPQYDSLLHKKLRESNLSLYNNMNTLTRENLINTVRAINSTNQQLVVSQIHIQDAASSLRKAYHSLTKLSDSLNTVLATCYIPEINIT